MLNSSYDGEIEQWDMIDKYSINDWNHVYYEK